MTQEIEFKGGNTDGVIYVGPLFSGQAGMQVLYRFPNGYGASIIRGIILHGYVEDPWHLAVIYFQGSGNDSWVLVYDTEITDDVLRSLTLKGVDDLLVMIAALPPRARL